MRITDRSREVRSTGAHCSFQLHRKVNDAQSRPNTYHALNVIGVDVENRSANRLGDVGAVRRRASVLRISCEAYKMSAA